MAYSMFLNGKRISAMLDGKRLVGPVKSIEKLLAPIISLDGDILSITTTDTRVKEFAIYVDEVKKATVETYTVSGTWVFNEDLGNLKDNTAGGRSAVTFTSNGTVFKSIDFELKCLQYSIYADGGYNPEIGEQDISVWDEGEWVNEAYRTITFDGVQEVSKEFYEWFTANAVRQTITFAIDGTSCTALSGMTWGEWVASEYNTGGFSIDTDMYIRLGSSYYIHKNGTIVTVTETIESTAYTLETAIIPT